MRAIPRNTPLAFDLSCKRRITDQSREDDLAVRRPELSGMCGNTRNSGTEGAFVPRTNKLMSARGSSLLGHAGIAVMFTITAATRRHIQFTLGREGEE